MLAWSGIGHTLCLAGPVHGCWLVSLPWWFGFHYCVCWAVSGALLIRPLTGVPCFATGVCFSTAGSVSDGTGSGCEGSLHMGSSHKSNPSVVCVRFCALGAAAVVASRGGKLGEA